MGNTRARYRRILRFAARYIVQTWWFELVLPGVGLSKFVARGRAARLTRIAQRFHALAVDLGGLTIKVGQYLSSRLDRARRLPLREVGTSEPLNWVLHHPHRQAPRGVVSR